MRTIIVHSRDAIINADPNDPTKVFAHCFGPFDSIEEAEAFDNLSPDACYKVALPLTGPDPLDIAMAMEWEARVEETTRRLS